MKAVLSIERVLRNAFNASEWHILPNLLRFCFIGQSALIFSFRAKTRDLSSLRSTVGSYDASNRLFCSCLSEVLVRKRLGSSSWASASRG